MWSKFWCQNGGNCLDRMYLETVMTEVNNVSRYDVIIRYKELVDRQDRASPRVGKT